MMRSRLLIPSLALAVAAVVGANAFAQNGGPQGRPLVVGVIDLGVVFKNYKRKDDLEKQITAQKQRIEAEATASRDNLQAMRKALDTFKEGTPGWRAQKFKLLTAMKGAEVAAQQAEEDLKAQVEGLTLQLLDEIEETVRDYGAKNKFDLIMKIDTKGWGDEKFQERIFRAQVSAVLYHDQNVDITNSVLQLLNDPANIQKWQSRTVQPGMPQPEVPPPKKP